MKESIVWIGDYQYRYAYDPVTKKMVYLGPVGSAPALLTEEQFKVMCHAMKEMGPSRKVMDETMEAIMVYADIHDDIPEEIRDLRWKGSYLPGNDAFIVITNAVPEYGDFYGSKVGDYITTGTNAKFQYALARESSPALYVKGMGERSDVAMMSKNARNWLHADEIHFTTGDGRVINMLTPKGRYTESKLKKIENEDVEDGELRIWWD